MSKIRESARGESCTMRVIDVCNANPETTVWAHANGVRFGKGFGIKVPDLIGAYACSNCHAVYDGQKPRPASMSKQDVELDFWRGHGESLVRLYERKLIGV